MTTYRIKLEFQNPYIGQRNGGDRVVLGGLPLELAQIYLLNLYNELFDRYASTWSAAVRQSAKYYDGAQPTQPGGLRELRYDSRIYKIERDEL